MFSGLVLLTPRHRRVEEEMVNVVTNLLESKEKENVQNNLFRSEQGTCFYEKRMPMEKNLLKKSFEENPTSRDKASDHSSTRLPWISPQSKSEDAEHIIQRKWRSPRHSLTQSAAVVVKDALIESAKGVIQYSNLLLEPHNGTSALTDIMMSVTKDEDMRSLRKAKLKRLRELLTRTEVSPKNC